MGADGHIKIIPVRKLQDKFGTEATALFCEKMVRSSVSYNQTLEGHSYISRYWGDNLYVTDRWDVLNECFENGEFDKKAYNYDEYEAKYLLENNTIEELRLFKDMITFAESNCERWEVWT